MKDNNNMVYLRKAIIFILLVIPVHYCYAQDIKLSVLNYNHLSKKVTVKVENHSNDSIWYALFPICYIDNHWSEPRWQIENKETLKSHINILKPVYAYRKLNTMEDTIQEGFADERMLDWYIYCFTHELDEVPKYSKRWWKIFRKEKKKYNFSEMDKRIVLIVRNFQTKEELKIYSEVLK